MKILTITQAERISKMIVYRSAKYVIESGIKSLVLGISGGLDSAHMAKSGILIINSLQAINYPVSYSFKFIDVESKPIDLYKAKLLAENLNFNLEIENLTTWYHQCPNRILNPTNHAQRVFNGNIKCRLRMINLYGTAQLSGGVVLDTDDLSEENMGFFTKHGDVGDIKVQQHLTKDEVRDMAEFYNVPSIIINSAPGDGLGVTENNQAQDQLKMTYTKTDYVISRMVQQGLNINGKIDQLENSRFVNIAEQIAYEIDEPSENVLHVLTQSLRTAFKRVGSDAVDLLRSRTEMGLPELGTDEFNDIYLKAIRL